MHGHFPQKCPKCTCSCGQVRAATPKTAEPFSGRSRTPLTGDVLSGIVRDAAGSSDTPATRVQSCKVVPHVRLS